jgi:signal transduction histidine kinase
VDSTSVGPECVPVIAAGRDLTSASLPIFKWLLRATPRAADWRTVGRMRALRRLREHADLAFALFCTVGMQIEIWFASYATHRPLLSLLGLLATVPLAFRCTHPLAGYLVTWLALFGIVSLSADFDGQSVFFVFVFVFALYSFGANARGRQAWAAAALIPLAIAAFVTDDGDPFHWGDIMFATLIIGGPWGAGVTIRLRRERERSLTLRTVELERDQGERARVAVAEERARIARELHDVVAHAISVVVVQARGGRKVLDNDPGASRTAFDSIERTGEQALGEMRRLLGMLRNDDEQSRAPQPSLERVEALAEEMRASGLPVELEIEGEPNGIPPGVDVSGYRIVQEALTNVLKHAGPAIALVGIRFTPEAVEIDVVDDGRGASAAPGTGNGLLGIRERVAVVGGEIEAGPRPDGGFAIHARLPYQEDA